jgi:hypothetical protein
MRELSRIASYAAIISIGRVIESLDPRGWVIAASVGGVSLVLAAIFDVMSDRGRRS